MIPRLGSLGVGLTKSRALTENKQPCFECSPLSLFITMMSFISIAWPLFYIQLPPGKHTLSITHKHKHMSSHISGSHARPFIAHTYTLTYVINVLPRLLIRETVLPHAEVCLPTQRIPMLQSLCFLLKSKTFSVCVCLQSPLHVVLITK